MACLLTLTNVNRPAMTSTSVFTSRDEAEAYGRKRVRADARLGRTTSMSIIEVGLNATVEVA